MYLFLLRVRCDSNDTSLFGFDDFRVKVCHLNRAETHQILLKKKEEENKCVRLK